MLWVDKLSTSKLFAILQLLVVDVDANNFLSTGEVGSFHARQADAAKSE